MAAALAAIALALTPVGNWVLLGAMALALLVAPEYASVALVYGITITAADAALAAIAGLSVPADRLSDAAIIYLAVYAVLLIIRTMKRLRPSHRG